MYMCTHDPDPGQSEGVCSCDYCECMYSTWELPTGLQWMQWWFLGRFWGFWKLVKLCPQLIFTATIVLSMHIDY